MDNVLSGWFDFWSLASYKFNKDNVRNYVPVDNRSSIARDLYLAKVANCLKTPTKSSDENTRV